MRFKIHGVSFKKRAPRAIKEIKDFATKAMVRKPLHTPEIYGANADRQTAADISGLRHGCCNRAANTSSRAPPTCVSTRS
jgi:hypothetical protein